MVLSFYYGLKASFWGLNLLNYLRVDFSNQLPNTFNAKNHLPAHDVFFLDLTLNWYALGYNMPHHRQR